MNINWSDVLKVLDALPPKLRMPAAIVFMLIFVGGAIIVGVKAIAGIWPFPPTSCMSTAQECSQIISCIEEEFDNKQCDELVVDRHAFFWSAAEAACVDTCLKGPAKHTCLRFICEGFPGNSSSDGEMSPSS